MNSWLKKLSEGASDTSALASSIMDSGIRSVAAAFAGIQCFSSLSATCVEDLEYDETHYILVPVIGKGGEYAIYTKRVLPDGVGETNSLPKARIFHVPDQSGKKMLERELVQSIVKERIEHVEGSSDLADTLEEIANQIDRETHKITGGLLLIGGVVAIVNPVVGIGIAAKSLFPSVGTKVTKAGAEYVGKKLRDWNLSKAESGVRKEISKEVQKLKPQIYVNPIVRSIEAIATDAESDYDPSLDEKNWADSFKSPHYYTITSEAVGEVYKDVVDDLAMRDFREAHVLWIRGFVSDSNREL